MKKIPCSFWRTPWILEDALCSRFPLKLHSKRWSSVCHDGPELTLSNTTLRTKFNFCLPFSPRKFDSYRWCSLLLAMNIVVSILTSVVNANIMMMCRNNVNANITRNTSPEGRTGSPAPSQDVSFSIKRTLGARLSLSPSPSPLPRSSPKSPPSFSVFEIEQMSQLRVQIIKMLVPWRLSTFFKSWPLDICSLFKKLVPWQLFTF